MEYRNLSDNDLIVRGEALSEKIEQDTKIFDDEALYEPRYTQVVYLKIDNNGDVDFNYKLAVTVANFTNGQNAWGDAIYLPDYLLYGVVFAESETELRQLVKDRLNARSHATNTWNAPGTWSTVSPYTHKVDKKLNDQDYAHYAALIVYMPEDVDNVANYVGATAPKVELGITVFAQQADAPIE